MKFDDDDNDDHDDHDDDHDDHDDHDEEDVHHAEQTSVEAFFGHFWPNLEN